jgi:hypothetical protein
METPQDEPDSEQELLHTAAARLLASSFDLSIEHVAVDARQVLNWQGSNDDLLTWLEARHSFPAGLAARYLRNLYVALRSSTRDA